jgi:2,3-bisphosphoglycerate-independent phosphoglycerate mutase
MTRKPPYLLIILDGWGIAESAPDNAIALAKTPTWQHLLTHYPHTTIATSGRDVGLPDGQMGNSEVGHMNIGAGRILLQQLPRIDQAMQDSSIAKHAEMTRLITTLQATGKACHLMGMLSDGGVHAHIEHMLALARLLANQHIHVWLHLFLDGRDVAPKSAALYLSQIEALCAVSPTIQIATISGRFYAMDRDHRYQRTALAYQAIVEAEGPRFTESAQMLSASYAKDQCDEFILPHVATIYEGMVEGDALLMVNFRADRVRQLLNALLDPEFGGFARQKIPAFAMAIGMVEYSSRLSERMTILFAPETITDSLGDILAKAGMTQARFAETEKYAHVTYFFSGGREEPFPGEERILIPSPSVVTYDQMPEMSAVALTDAVIEGITSQRYDVMIVNYANTDMVGHSGNLQATITAVETVDACLGRIMQALTPVKGVMLITADHGNAEQMHDGQSNGPHTSHTTNPVPLILVGPELLCKRCHLRPGRLADIAPTLLQLMQLPQPTAMTGTSLLSGDLNALSS